jgi:lipopolysaccharide/colanic/teichoic acid biosynthesis glycosyltransferase
MTNRRGQSRVYGASKRTLDVVGSAIGLILAALPMAVIALLVKLDDRSAPVLFRQRRCGLDARQIDILKFRTMVADAERLKEALREQSSVAWPDFSLKNDPRVTRIGRFLRKTSLDELPQLWCVLRGDMSLVGPRPTTFDYDSYDLWQTERLQFRPGVTGPWQVLGRGSMEFTERCRLEISFFRRPSVWRELRLLLRTVPVMLRRTGAA